MTIFIITIIILSAVTFVMATAKNSEAVAQIFTDVRPSCLISIGRFIVGAFGAASAITIFSTIVIVAIFQIAKLF